MSQIDIFSGQPTPEKKPKLKPLPPAEIVATVTSVSGGKTSAYLASEFPTDYNVFALVCVDDPKLRHKDEKMIQWANDKLEKTNFLSIYGEFQGTAEDDTILYTIADLEQYMGREICIVRGLSYEQVIATKGGWLPNKLHRYCTTNMKLLPMFEWWLMNFEGPVEMQIGFRANPNEIRRANKMHKRLVNGLLQMKYPLSCNNYGKFIHRHTKVPWQKPKFTLAEKGIFREDIIKHWIGKNVRFAEFNNCTHCFTRDPLLLAYQFIAHPEKGDWWIGQEGGDNGYWKSKDGQVTPYNKIKEDYVPIVERQGLGFGDFGGCDSGYCEPF